MKNYIKNSINLAMGFIILLVIGCKTAPVATKQETTENNIYKTIETSNTILKNLAVLDSLKIEIAKIKSNKPECDSLINAKITEVLSTLNTSKQSGGNNYGFYFDKLKNQLVAYIKQAETNNTSYVRVDTIFIQKKQLQQVQIPVRYTPQYIKWLARLGVVLSLIFVFIIYKRLTR